MSMYLPNPDLYPTGDEPAEFLEIPPMAQCTPEAGTSAEQEAGSIRGPDMETELNTTGDHRPSPV